MLRYTFMTSACAFALAGPAIAQVAPPSEGKTVYEQYREEYRASGARIGAFMVTPYASAATTYTDNLFAVEPTDDLTVPAQFRDKENAFIFTVTGGVSAKTDWSSHGLSAYADVTTEQVTDFDDESATTYQAGGSAFLDVGLASRITVGGAYVSDVEERNARFTQTQSQSRVEFDESELFVEARREAGIIKIKAAAERSTLDFDRAFVDNGDAVIDANDFRDQDFRDREAYRFSTRVSAEVGPSLDVFVGGDYLITDFQEPTAGNPLDRDSKQWGVDAGFAMNFTNLLRGEAAFGYSQRDVEDPSIDNREIITSKVGLEWFVSPLTTVTLNAKRDIRDALFDNALSSTRSEVKLGVQRRISPRIVAGVNGAFQDFDFDGTVDVTPTTTRNLDRRDRDYVVRANVTYALKKGVDVAFDYSRQERDSSGLDGNRSFTDNRLTLTLGVAF